MNKLESTKQFIQQYEHLTYQHPAIDLTGTPWNIAHRALHESHAPWLHLDLEGPWSEMLAEAQALKDRFVVHREGDGQGWKSLCIHGMSAEQTDAPNMYGYDHETAPYVWTDIIDRCPVTYNYFRDVFPFQKYHRLRFMLLEPGGYIIPHSDNRTSNLGAATNISLNNPVGCRMVTELGVVPFKPQGGAVLFNNHYHHVVFNDSDQDRFHIIVHGMWDGRRWDPMVARSYQKAMQHG